METSTAPIDSDGLAELGHVNTKQLLAFVNFKFLTIVGLNLLLSKIEVLGNF